MQGLWLVRRIVPSRVPVPGAGAKQVRRPSRRSTPGQDCTGCGACFYCCPEPGAIIVYRLISPAKAVSGRSCRSRRWPMRQLCKGNVAVVKGAVLAGCKAYYGYPITPASEIAEYAVATSYPRWAVLSCRRKVKYQPSTWCTVRPRRAMRVMSASSGPRLSLMQEGMSYIAGAELPCVIVDVVRGGPGLGNIAPEQSDYFCIVKGGGHGCYRNIVLAPSSVQEMFDLTVLAFRACRPLSQSCGHHDRRLRRPDDGAAGYPVAQDRSSGKRTGRSKARRRRRRT